MKKINIGVLGCANIARRSVIPAVLGLKDQYNLIGIASRDPQKAKLYAEDFQIRAFGGYESLIDSGLIDAVYIPLPNSLHGEWVEKALNSGIHVLVEKSMACDYEDVLRLNQLARQKKLTLVENFQFRFHGQLKKIKELLADGIVGELRCFRSSFGFSGLPSEADIRYQKSLGGGALLDTGAYPLKLAQIFLGLDVEISSANLNYLPHKEVDMWGGAYVKQKKGDLFGELAFGFDNYYQCNLELWGSKGKIYTNRIFTAPSDFQPTIELEISEGKETIILPAENHFENMLKYFYELVQGEADNEDEYQQNINQARLINEIKQKANGR